MGKRKQKVKNRNDAFTDSLYMNSATYLDYLSRLKQLAMARFEWINLPSSMNARFIEQVLYYRGQSTVLKADLGEITNNRKLAGTKQIINTQCTSSGQLNIYYLPTEFHCYSIQFDTMRKLYSGLDESNSDEECVLIMNNPDMIPTCKAIELFAYKLAESDMTALINIKAQKTPVMIVCDEEQRLMMENLYSQYEGNRPFIFGDKKQLGADTIRAITTNAPFIADKILAYKKEVWNECLAYLGINNIIGEKKERLVTDEVNVNNELINYNLQSFLKPRQKAVEEINNLFGLDIEVKVNSDLANIIKNTESAIMGQNSNIMGQGSDNNE